MLPGDCGLRYVPGRFSPTMYLQAAGAERADFFQDLLDAGGQGPIAGHRPARLHPLGAAAGAAVDAAAAARGGCLAGATAGLEPGGRGTWRSTMSRPLPARWTCLDRFRRPGRHARAREPPGDGACAGVARRWPSPRPPAPRATAACTLWCGPRTGPPSPATPAHSPAAGPRSSLSLDGQWTCVPAGPARPRPG